MDLELLRVMDHKYNRSDMLLRLFLAFGITLVFAPWSIGLTYFLLFLVFYEILFFWRYRRYPIVERLGLVAASYLGWLVGRYLIEETSDEDVLEDLRERARWVTGLINSSA